MNAIDKAIQIAGGQVKLADAVGCRQATVSYWAKVGRVGHNFTLKVEAATGVSRHELRPDLYPMEAAR